ncbi:hypothetical protein [Teichococcus aestuarii]|uniref:hypothetical protein n=1 Tax=Teichococcus aestuarii TaxID=568898 RepID=UPI00361D74A0
MTSVTLPHQPAARPDILLDTGRVAALYQKRAGETLIVSFAPGRSALPSGGSPFSAASASRCWG